MGDNYLEAQAKNTKKRRAKGTVKINSPTLLSRADRIFDRYTVDCFDGYEIAKGDVLICFAGPSPGVIEVVQGHQRVGEVTLLGGGESLTAEIQSDGIGHLRVTSVDLVGGSVQVEPIKEEADGYER